VRAIITGCGVNVFRTVSRAALVLVGALFPATGRTQARTVADSAAFRRAQRVLDSGDTTRAGALLDSLVAATADGSAARADALYWRALITPNADAARVDLLTIVVDYSLAPRAADALLRLGQSAFAAGDRTAALRFLDQLVLEHPSSAAAAQGWFWLGRARLDNNAMQSGCAALDSARKRLPASDVERRRQVDFAAGPCRALAAAPPAPAPASPGAAAGSTGGAAAGGSTRPKPAQADTSTARRYSVQVAAYKSKADADKLVERLKTRGYEARVDELAQFHVRIGLFKTRAEATALVTKLKAQQITGFVVEASRRGP